jgi:hypothetical protein
MQPLFSAGQLEGCTMIYSAIARDWSYKQGGYIRVDGSFGLLYAKGQIGISLKVGLQDINPRTKSFTPSPLRSAFRVRQQDHQKRGCG